MARPARLNDDEIATRTAGLEGWTVASGKLHKEFVFDDFVAAFGFMTRVALAAERMDHHPEWFNVYKTVKIDLRTHDCDGISDLDFELARKIDALA